MNTFNLSLDLDKSASLPTIVRIRQGDVDGTTIAATVYDHGMALGGTVKAAEFVMKLPDGAHYYRKAASYSGGVATVTIDETQAASAVGRTALAYFKLTVGSATYSTAAFVVIVEPDAVGDASVPESYDTEIQAAIDALAEATAAIPSQVVEEVDAQLAEHPEWTTTVQDNSVTDAKLVQQGGVLSRVGRLMHRLDNLLTATPDESDALAVSDAAQTPIVGLAAYGRSTQDGTPTPSTPVPIESVTGDSDGNISLTLAGRNLWGGERLKNDVLNAGANATSGEDTYGAYVSFGAAQVSGKTLCSGPFKENTQYTLVFKLLRNASSNTTNMLVVYTDDTTENITRVTPSDTSQPTTFAFVTSASKTVQKIRGINRGNTTFLYYDQCGIFEGVLTADDFVPYVGTTMPIDLQGHELRSLPDGTRDELVVDAEGNVTLVQRVGEYALPSSNWERSSAYGNSMRIRLSYLANDLTAQAYRTPLSNVFKGVGSSAEMDAADYMYTTYVVSSTGIPYLYVTITDDEYSAGADAFGAAVAAAGGRVSLPLATPQTIDLGTVDLISPPDHDMTAWMAPTAPFRLTYERGANVALADATDAALAAIAPVENGTASTNYAVGSYLVHDGALYRVTTAIATGEAIVPGTNATATTVMAEVIALAQ